MPERRTIRQSWFEIGRRSGLTLPHLETRWPDPLVRWRERFPSIWIDRLLLGVTAAPIRLPAPENGVQADAVNLAL